MKNSQGDCIHAHTKGSSPDGKKENEEWECIDCGISIHSPRTRIILTQSERLLQEAKRISDIPEVDETIRNFLEDQTEDNVVEMVRSILNNARFVK